MAPILSQRVTFAAVTADDFDEPVTIRIAAMRESLERVGRFDPVRARERLKKSFYPEHTQLVLLDSQKIGFYTLRLQDGCYQLDHLYVHPAFQSRGIGSYVMSRLLAYTDSRGVSIRLGALRESSSNRFYQRHGFLKTTEDEWDIYYIRSSVKIDTPHIPRVDDVSMSVQTFWDHCYTSPKAEEDMKYTPWLDRWKHLLSGSRALDIGCGLGHDTAVLSSYGLSVTALDISFEALKKSAARNPHAKHQRCDLQSGLKLDGDKFSVAVANLSLHYFDRDRTLRLMREISDVLDDHGVFAFRLNAFGD